MRLAFTQGLDHETFDSVFEIRIRRAIVLERPRPQQRLIDQIFFVCVRRQATFMLAELVLVPAMPSIDVAGPCAGHLREQVDAGAYVFTALSVVGRGGVHRAAPVNTAIEIELVEPVHTKRLRASTHIVHRDEPII